MEILISEWILIALVVFPFLTGFFTGMKIVKVNYALYLLKKLPPSEFEKLLEDHESKNTGTIDS